MKYLLLTSTVLVLTSPSMLSQAQCAWSPLGPVSPPGWIASVRDIVVHDDGSGAAQFWGVSFVSSTPVVPSLGVLRHDVSGTTVPGSGLPGLVHALERFDEGAGKVLFAGGELSANAGAPSGHIARWDGASWSGVGGGVSTSPSSGLILSRVRAIEVFDDGSGPALYVGGVFTQAGTSAALHIARWNGTSWSQVGGGIGLGPFDEGVYSLRVFDDGSGPALFAAGSFSSAGGIPMSNIARWDGSVWSPVGGGLSSAFPMSFVNALVVFDDGSGPALYAGGLFNTAGAATQVGHVGRWDGTAWSAAGSGPGFDEVLSFGVYDDGTGPGLYAGGRWVDVANFSASFGRVSRWDGNSWAPVPLGGALDVTQVSALAVVEEAGGPVLQVGGEARVFSATAIESMMCPQASLSLSFSQSAGPGGALSLANSNLQPGHEYRNIFSLDVCPGGVGSGVFGGLCISSASNASFIGLQLTAPAGLLPLHFVAADAYVLSPPLQNVPPVTLEALCVDVSGGVVGPVSPVVSIVVQ